MSEKEFWAAVGLPYWAALSVAYAAFWIYLTVRFVNGRKQWAKRMALAAVVVPVLYALSSGPMKTMAWRGHVTTTATTVGGPVMSEIAVDPGQWWLRAYAPLWWLSDQSWAHP